MLEIPSLGSESHPEGSAPSPEIVVGLEVQPQLAHTASKENQSQGLRVSKGWSHQYGEQKQEESL